VKIWNQYGSEHSMNLVMIGTFKETRNAESAKQLIDTLIDYVRNEPPRSYDDDPRESRFSKATMDFMIGAKLSTIGASELEQFQYEVHVEIEGNKVVLKTDESEVSGFMKLLIEKGARVEVYSAHDYPDEPKK
jgi:hypothetical protein